GHVLIVEDDEDAARTIGALAKREGHTAMHATSIGAARRLVAMQPPDMLLLDLHLPDGHGFELLEGEHGFADTLLVLMTGQASLETSIRALRLGAADYLVKPINPRHLQGLLSRMIAPAQLRAELREVQEQWQETGRFGQLIGRSECMQQVYRQIARVAGTAVSVFIHGESGTGKELAARAVHDMSRRRDQPFLAVNCGALSPHLVESEIFGHERGSFTGAERQHQGFFERAHGGTLFLDEVTEMPLELQVKLLRVLETGTFMRVGSTQVQQTDVRIIAATNRDAAAAVAAGRMREDLLYRLNVFPIFLPPLRQREDDVSMIATSFLQDFSQREGTPKSWTPGALARLAAHAWPGNVRELRNAVQRAWVMATGPAVDEEWLPGAPASASGPGPVSPAVPAPSVAAAGGDRIVVAVGTPLAAVEQRLILATYEHCAGNRERTAAMLGISMKTLYNRLKEYRE
ncbi:MAG: sigma-54-dependent Fis family transcriptional regulator, partial [Variovorax sp.]